MPPAGRAGEGVCVTQVAGAVLALLSGGESAVVGPIAHRGLARASPLVLHFGVFISILRACVGLVFYESFQMAIDAYTDANTAAPYTRSFS